MKSFFVTSLLLSTFFAHSQNRQQFLKDADKLVADSNYGKAITIYDKLLDKDSTDYEVYEKRGNLYKDMRDYQQAFKDFTLSIHYNNHNSLALISRADLFRMMEYYEESLKDYTAALPNTEKKELRVLIFVDRGEINRRLKRLEDAVQDFKSAYKIDSTSLGTLADLGNALSEIGKRPEAIFYLEKAIAIDSTFEGGIGNLAFLYSEMGNYRKAIELGDKLLRIKPNEPFALNNRGYSKMQSGDLEGALEDINNSILIFPGNSFAFRNRGLLYLKLHKDERACHDFSMALSLNFTKDYGDEVETLKKKHCQPKEEVKKQAL